MNKNYGNNFNIPTEEMYTLEDVFNPLPNLLNLASIFYILEGMKAYVSLSFKDRTPTVQRFLDDVSDYLNYISKHLSLAIYDYTVLVVYGEMRYTGEFGNYRAGSYNGWVGYVFNHPLLQYSASNSSRHNYTHNIKYGAFFTPESIKRTARIIFDTWYFNWSRNYGGEKWRKITNLIDDYRSLSHVVFIDKAFDTQHNTSVYLDKNAGIFASEDFYGLKDFLDDKREKTIFSIINDYSRLVDYKTMKFIQRFHGLCVFKYKETLKGLDDTGWGTGAYVDDIYENMSLLTYGHNINLIEDLLSKITMQRYARGNLSVYALEHRKPIQWGSDDFGKLFYEWKPPVTNNSLF